MTSPVGPEIMFGGYTLFAKRGVISEARAGITDEDPLFRWLIDHICIQHAERSRKQSNKK